MTDRRPVISFVVPCYNSAAYMDRCLDSLLVHPDDTEVIIIDDGSTDATAEIGRSYEERHPGVVRLVSQPNGGHGIAMQSGIREASGTYLKVVDSDDWLDRDALDELVTRMRAWQDARDEAPDLVIANYVYENQELGPRKVVYGAVLPRDRIFGWDEVGRFKQGQYMLMHSLIYRLDMLRNAAIEFPRKTFYVDNLIAMLPLTSVHRMAYLDIDLYRYFVGRDDQSVNEKVMVGRIDQHLLVNTLLVDQIRPEDLVEPQLRRYLIHYMSVLTSISLMLVLLADTPEAYEKKRVFLAHLKQVNPGFYRAWRRHPTAPFLLAPGRAMRWLTVSGYRVVRRVFAFN